MYLSEIPNDILIYVMSFLDIRKDDISIIRTLNSKCFELSNQRLTLEYYPWNKLESFSGLTLSYHTLRVQRRRMMEISDIIDFDKELEIMLRDNEWI